MEIALAQAIGAHPITAYLTGLAVVLLIATLLWLMVRHAEHALDRATTRPHLVLRLVTGFVVILELSQRAQLGCCSDLWDARLCRMDSWLRRK
jgi:hypothetical protein